MDNSQIAQLNSDFGCIMFLYSKSDLHASWGVGMASRYVLPALLAKQYVIMKDHSGTPLGYVSWAYLDLAAEVKYLENPHSLSINDWKSGDRLWFIDYVSPVDPKITDEISHHLAHNLFANSVARSLRLKPGDSQAKIKSYGGSQITIKERRLILSKYLAELKDFIGDKPTKIVF